MVSVRRVMKQGNLMFVQMDDGSKVACYPTPSGFWIARANSYGATDPGDGGGENPDPGEGGIYNPWAGYSVSGSWADHGSYSQGGIDYPLAYDTPLPAPCAGTVRTEGGSGEFEAGYVRSAGRRTVFECDQAWPAKYPPESYPQEGDGPMVAIVIQHQANYAYQGHYNKGEIIGWSGASANGDDYGGDIHLHVHGLNAAGRRVDFTKYV